MLYLFTSIIGLLISKGKGSISRTLFLLLMVTSIGAFLVGRQPVVSDVTDLLVIIYTSILLFILLSAFKNYRNLKTISLEAYDEGRLHKLEKVLCYSAVFVLLLNIYIFYKIFPLLLTEAIVVDDYKNDGGATDIIDSYVPHILITISNFISPIGYFFVGLHFLYLIKGNSKKTVLFFVLSLIIIISRLIALSRSTMIEYLTMYGTIFLFITPLLNHRLKKKIYRVLCVFGVCFIAIFATISNSRFSEYYSKKGLNEAILDETSSPLAFSLVDYLSQWVEINGIAIKELDSENMMYGGYGFSGVSTWVLRRIEGPSYDIRQTKKIEATLHDYKSGFSGLMASLVIDFGRIGAFLFVLLFAFFIRKLSPQKGVLNMKTIIWLPIIMNVVAMFWAGNFFSSLSLEMAIVYNFIWMHYLKKTKPSCQVP